MNRIKICDSAGTLLKHLYQWDTNQSIVISGIETGAVTEVHFSHTNSNKALVVVPSITESGIVVAVPNILLQQAIPIMLYVVHDSDALSSRTTNSAKITVSPRPKPADYIYTETEVLSYSYLDKRLQDLEGEGLANAVADYLEENPVEAGATEEEAAQIKQNKENIEKLTTDKLDASKLPEAVNDALAQAKASGEFDGKDGQDGKDGVDGKDGYTPQKGIDYFDGKDGEKGDTGPAGEPGEDGAPGEPGYTPVKGVDYFTEEDKKEVAEHAAQLVEIPKVSGFVTQDTAPEDTAVLWVDPSDNTEDSGGTLPEYDGELLCEAVLPSGSEVGTLIPLGITMADLDEYSELYFKWAGASNTGLQNVYIMPRGVSLGNGSLMRISSASMAALVVREFENPNIVTVYHGSGNPSTIYDPVSVFSYFGSESQASLLYRAAARLDWTNINRANDLVINNSYAKPTINYTLKIYGIKRM